MKKSLVTLLAVMAVGSFANAATDESYTAFGDPNLGGDSNGGTADAWTVAHVGGGAAPNNYGSFAGDSAQNGGGGTPGPAGNPAWALYSNYDYAGATGDNEVDMNHSFSGGALSIGQTVSIAFDAGYVDSQGTVDGAGFTAPSNGSYGIRLLGPSSSFVFALSFIGGGANYGYYDATNVGTNSGEGYNPNGFTFSYTQTSATTYTASITDTGGTHTFSGTVSGAPTSIQVYNNDAGSGANYDVFSNNLVVAVPEPSSLALIGAGAASFLAFRRRVKRAS